MALPSTHWSLLDAVREGPNALHREALQALAKRYHYPAYLHVRARGLDHSSAQDLVQDFFENCLMRELFGRADRSRGRFRNYFLTALDNFTRNAWRAQAAQRRMPEGGLVPLEDDTPAIVEGLEQQFFRAFASQTVARVLDEVAAQCAAGGQDQHFLAFRRCVVEPALDGAEAPSAQSLAEQLGITPKQVGNYLVTVKRMFRRRLQAHVATYACDENDAVAEIRELMSYLERP